MLQTKQSKIKLLKNKIINLKGLPGETVKVTIKRLYAILENRSSLLDSNNIIRQKQRIHLLSTSPVPVLTSISLTIFTATVVLLFHNDSYFFACELGIIGLVFSIIYWLKQVIVEAKSGYHTDIVTYGLRLGFCLFLLYEIFFFIAFFWGYFHNSLSPGIGVGFMWPPAGINAVHIFELPWINTILLITSGLILNIVHKNLVSYYSISNFYTASILIMLSVFLGLTFIFCQGIEYTYGLLFTWKNSILGTTFFSITSFHGFHVFVGAIGLIITMYRIHCIFWFQLRKFYFRNLYFDKCVSKYTLIGSRFLWRVVTLEYFKK